MTERWSNRLEKRVEVPAIDAFLDDIEAVYRRHGLSISHEDFQGAFEIELFNLHDLEWLRNAHDARVENQPQE